MIKATPNRHLGRHHVAVLDVVDKLLPAPQPRKVNVSAQLHPPGGKITTVFPFHIHIYIVEHLKAKSVSPTASYPILCQPLACSAAATSSLRSRHPRGDLRGNGGNNLLLPLET
jgi:hypothetical protein